MFKKKGVPERGELVLITVTETSDTFIKGILDEYEGNLIGVIPIDEVSYKRIRSLKKYVEIGKKLVCKVLEQDPVTRVFTLSLKRVSEGEKQMKLYEYKREKVAAAIVRSLGEKMGLSEEILRKEIVDKIYDNKETLYKVFEEAVLEGKKALTKRGIKKKYADILYELISERIKSKEYIRRGYLYVQSLASDGVDRIRKLFHALSKKYEVTVRYIAAPKYEFLMKDTDPKKLDKKYKKFVSEFENLAEKMDMIYDLEEL